MLTGTALWLSLLIVLQDKKSKIQETNLLSKPNYNQYCSKFLFSIFAYSSVGTEPNIVTLYLMGKQIAE